MPALTPVLDHLDANLDGSLERLFGLLRIKSISTDPDYAAECRRAADWLVADLKSIGFDASVRDTPGHPMVVAHHDGDGPHVLFYGHYDVQPVDPLDLWKADPFAPSLGTGDKGQKVINARGSADDKGQLMTFVEACRAYKSVHGKLPCKVTILFEGEEESGSPSLKPFLRDNAKELTAEFALVCDTGMWDSDTPSICVGLRGLVGDEVTVHAANRDLHSGEFGGAAANPIRVLAKILAAVHDDNGHVTIPGFYDGVEETPSQIKKAWDALGETPETFLGEIGLSVPSGEKGRSVLELVWARPTAEFNGITGGYTGKGFKTVIAAKDLVPAGAQAGPGQDPRGLPRIRARAAACRLLGRVRGARQLAGHPALLRIDLPQQGQGSAFRRMAQAGGDACQRRLDPGRRGFPKTARHGIIDGRLRPVRRPHPFAEREVRSRLVPQGPAVVGTHPRPYRSALRKPQ
jgi:acetylornithine deacetylase/succinyl-diaminopimelate desuccinylase-like protein